MPGDPRIRVSDADRDRTAELLREHHAEGRLTAEEFHERLDRTLVAKTRGELDELLADLPGIDLYRLPAAGIRPAPPGALRRRSRPGTWPGGSGLDRSGQRGLMPRRAGAWAAWTAVSALLFALWVSVGAISGGAAWFPWFLLVCVPWAISLARRPPRSP
jgi:hypothetical protein